MVRSQRMSQIWVRVLEPQPRKAKGIMCACGWLAPEKGNFIIWHVHTLAVGATPFLAQTNMGGRNHVEIWGFTNMCFHTCHVQ